MNSEEDKEKTRTAVDSPYSDTYPEGEVEDPSQVLKPGEILASTVTSTAVSRPLTLNWKWVTVPLSFCPLYLVPFVTSELFIANPI